MPAGPEVYAEPRPRRWDPSFFAAATREDVLAYVADPANRPAWQASLRSVEVRTGGPPRVGTRWVDRLHGGVRFPLETVALEPPRLWAEVGHVGPLTAYLTVVLEEEVRAGVHGTRVHVMPRIRGRGAGRPLGWLATAAMALLVRTDLPRLRRLLERRA